MTTSRQPIPFPPRAGGHVAAGGGEAPRAARAASRPHAVLGVWDWAVSARVRLASLVATWVMLFAGGLLGPLSLPVVALRLAATPVQCVLNGRLNRRVPLARRDGWDWALLGVAFLASCGVSALFAEPGRVVVPTEVNPLLLLPVLLPYSAIQLRTNARCWSAVAALRATPTSEAAAATSEGAAISEGRGRILEFPASAASEERRAA